MRVIFNVDYKNYKESGSIGKRPSARAIIIKDGFLAMVYSNKYDYYKFPGGGIENNESNRDALIREVKEEVGLEVIENSIKEYGLYIRKEAGITEDIFIQENYYYLCNVKDSILKQKLDDYESKERFELKWVKPFDIIDTNLNHSHGNKDSLSAKNMFLREVEVVKLLIKEKFI